MSGTGIRSAGAKAPSAVAEKDADAALTLAGDEIEFTIVVDVGGDEGAGTVGILANHLKGGSSFKSALAIAESSGAAGPYSLRLPDPGARPN